MRATIGRRNLLLSSGAVALSCAIPARSHGQTNYPVKPIRLVVGFAPGGATDLIARVVGEQISRDWNVQVIVDNKPGVAGSLGADIVAKAIGDGYTLGVAGTPQVVTNQFVYKTMPYDSATAFTPVALLGEVPNVLAVHADVPVRTVEEFITYVKARPGKLDYGSPGVGGSGHLAMEYFSSLTGIQMEHVIYKGSSLVVQDLLAGRLTATIDNLPVYLPHIRSGKIVALAVSSSRRWPALPEVPTIAESGLPGFNAAPWWCMLAPATMPAEIVSKLSDGIVRGLATPAMVQRFDAIGVSPLPGSNVELADFIARETVKWKEVVTNAKLTPQ